MSNCVLGPNEAGVFLTQICYELLMNVQFEKNFDIKLWKSRLDKPFQLDTLCYEIVKKWNQFLEEAPLADIIQWKLKHFPHLRTIIGLLNILSSNYILLKTTICLTTQIMNGDFERNLYNEFLEMINVLNPNLLEWIEKVQDLHITYCNYGKPKNWKTIAKERNSQQFRKELKNQLLYIETRDDDEEIKMIVENIYSKMNFQDKPLQFLSYYNNIMNKNDLKKQIIAATYLDENLLYKISRIKTNSNTLNKNLEIFFKLMNYKHRFYENEEEWKIWLKDEYLKQTNINLEDAQNIKKKQEEILKNEIKYKTEENLNIIFDIKEKNQQHYEWINLKNVQQTIVNHINFMNNSWNSIKNDEINKKN